MKSKKLHPLALLTLPLALLVSGCGGQGKIRVALPAAQDLRTTPKPVPGPEIVEDATAEALFNSAIEAWGEAGWAQVGRLCRWAKEHGSKEPCPPPSQ